MPERAAAMRSLSRHARALALGTRAAAAVELALGSAVLLAVAVAGFDLYKYVKADAISAQFAATMADYVSRGPDEGETTIDGDALKALGTFIHEHTHGGPADLVFVISALKQGTDNPAPAVKALWSDATLRFGDATVTTELAGNCARYVEENQGSSTVRNLPAGFKMVAGEVLVIVEVCARAGALSALAIGDIYRLHVLPLRNSERDLPAPTHARMAAGAQHARASRAGVTRPTHRAAQA